MISIFVNPGSKEQKKNKESVLAAESAYNAKTAQFGLVIIRSWLIYGAQASAESQKTSKILGLTEEKFAKNLSKLNTKILFEDEINDF